VTTTLTTKDRAQSASRDEAASAAEAKPMLGAQIIWEAIAREDINVVFGYPGGAIMPAYDALPQVPAVHHVLVRHEQGAAHMADGYARATGKVGCAVATSGPGATNLVTGIATAMLDSVPVVFITGQVASPLLGSDAFQETDITGVTLPITKHNFLVTRVEDIAPTIKKAFYIARSGRPGPVVVDITKDAQQQSCVVDWNEPVRLPGYRPEHHPKGADYEEAIKLINEAKRPIIFCGHGVIKSGATQDLVEFAEKANIPVAETLLGLGGFPATHPLSVGMMGMHGEAWVNAAIQEADLIVALGMRFDDRVTGNLKTYAPKAKKIHVELDPAEINKNVRVDVALIGDVGEIVRAWNPRVRKQERKDWWTWINSVKGDHAVRDIKDIPDLGKLYAAHVIHDLWKLTDGKALVVTDVGQHQMWEAQYYKHDYPRRLLTSGGLGTMGFALPAAIGAKFACPEDEVWVVVGDGGFQMTQAELQTCRQEGIKVNVCIINNGYLGMVRQWQEFFYGGRYVATPMSSPDFVKLADAHGLKGIRVTKREEIAEAVAAARAEKGTVVIEFVVEQEDSVYPMVPAGADLDKMILRPVAEGQKHNPIFETGEDE
jgi:acetolactate synthase-1/2/3 large subunit